MTPLRVLDPGEMPPAGTCVLVHIGKCGGSSLRAALQGTEAGRGMVVAHVTPPPVSPDLRYVICLRHPVSRALSAFNWRRKLVIEDGTQSDRFPGERAVLERHETLENLARALPEAAADWRKVHHLREDIAFYLAPLLHAVHPDQIAAVVIQERLDADIQRQFGVRNPYRVHHHANDLDSARMTLSREAESRLRAFLQEDFACIAQLHAWKKLDDAAFDLVHG